MPPDSRSQGPIERFFTRLYGGPETGPYGPEHPVDETASGAEICSLCGRSESEHRLERDGDGEGARRYCPTE